MSAARARSAVRLVARCGLVLATLCLPVSPALAEGAAYPPPVEGDFVTRDFHFTSGESLPELRIHYRTFGKPRADAPRRGAQRGAGAARHRRRRRQPGARRVCRRAVRPGAAARCHALLHRAARRHRPRQVDQAERRPARALSALRLRRHGARGVPAAHRGAEGQPRASRHGHLHGRHAHLAVGRAAPASSWTHSCRSRACRPRSRAATASGAA